LIKEKIFDDPRIEWLFTVPHSQMKALPSRATASIPNPAPPTWPRFETITVTTNLSTTFWFLASSCSSHRPNFSPIAIPLVTLIKGRCCAETTSPFTDIATVIGEEPGYLDGRSIARKFPKSGTMPYPETDVFVIYFVLIA
jgi:hypothetical protein